VSAILKACFLAGVIWTAGLAGDEPAIPWSVRIYYYANVPEPVLLAAQAEAARIFLQAGIDVLWIRCAGSDEEFAASPHKFGACAQAPRTVTVRIEPVSLAGQTSRLPSSVAAAAEERVEIVYGRLLEFSSEQNFKPGLLLAHVMAHELGHVLLGERSHASEGIMIPTFRNKDLYRAQRGRLLFTAKQAQRMRMRLNAVQ
jgi:hypothetical protein